MRTSRSTAGALGLVLALSSAAVMGTGKLGATPPAQASGRAASGTAAHARAGHHPGAAHAAPAAHAGHAAARPHPGRPNIFMITVDDAAPDDLAHMPHVRKLLVDKGVRVANGLAPTPICVPARATLLTGQFAHNHGALTIDGESGGFKSFRHDGNTLPVWLQRAGYDTLFVGKYLNGYGGHHARYVPPGWTDWRGSVDPWTYEFNRAVINHDGHVTRRREYNTTAFARAVDTDLSAKRRTKKPWYLWVNYVAPHIGGPRDRDDPIVTHPHARRIPTTSPAPKYRNYFAGLPLPDKPNMFESDVSDKVMHPAKATWSPMLRGLVREMYEQRLEALKSVDDAVARHIAILRRTGQLDNTLIVFSSDNGFNVGEHNLIGKLWYFRDSSQLPMVMRGPGLAKGTTTKTIVSNADLPVTFAALAHARPGRVVDGENVMPWLRSGRNVERVVPLEGYPVDGGRRRIYSAIRVGDRWNYARLGSREELYDLRADPYELDNVADEPSYAATLARMRGLDRTYRNCAGDSCPRGAYRG